MRFISEARSQTLQVKMTPSQYDHLRLAAQARGISMSGLALLALDDYFAAEPSPSSSSSSGVASRKTPKSIAADSAVGSSKLPSASKQKVKATAKRAPSKRTSRTQ